MTAKQIMKCQVLAMMVALFAAVAARAEISELVVTDDLKTAEVKGRKVLQRQGTALFAFNLDQAADVTIEVYADAAYAPKLLDTLNLGRQPAGRVEAKWAGPADDTKLPVLWRTFSCVVKTGGSSATAYWQAVDAIPVPENKLSLRVVPGRHLLLAEGNEMVPYSLQVINAGDRAVEIPLKGVIRTAQKQTVQEIAETVTAAAMAVTARTFAFTPEENGIFDGSFTADDANASMTFGRVTPHRKRFERDSAFASIWFRDCAFGDAIGVKYSRQNDVNWTNIQKQPGQPYYWGDPEVRATTLDGFMVDREKNHMWMLSILGYGEDWLGGSFVGCTIYNYDRYVNDYCAEVYRHMKGHHSLLQNWNEPNFFWHVPMDQYYLVQQRVFSRIKTFDKNAFIMLDGHTGARSNEHFLTRMAELGYAPYATAIAVHYPEGTAHHDSLVGRVESKADNTAGLFDIRDRYFPAVEVWNTEEGLWGDRRWQQDAVATARDLPKVYITQIAAGFERIFWFSMKGDNLTYLLRPDGTISEPAISYAAMTQLLEGAEFMGYASPEEGMRQYLFANAGKPVMVAWNNAPEKDFEIFVNAEQVQVQDFYGNARTVESRNGIATVKLNEQPVYIVNASPLLLIDALKTEAAEQATQPAVLADAPSLMEDIRQAAKKAAVDEAVVAEFENRWNDGVARIAFCFQSYGLELPDLGDNHPSAMVTRMIDAAQPVRAAFVKTAAKPEAKAAAITGLFKLNCLLQKAAEVLAIWPDQANRQLLAEAQQALLLQDFNIGELEGSEYKPSARAMLSQLNKMMRKADQDAEDGLGCAADARAEIAKASAEGLTEIARTEDSVVISCVLNAYVNPELKPLDRYMKLFDTKVVPGRSFPLEINIDNYADVSRNGTVELELPEGWTCSPKAVELSLEPGALATAGRFSVTAPAAAPVGEEVKIGASFAAEDVAVTEAYPITVEVVPAIDITALTVDDPASPQHLVPRVVSHVVADEFMVSVEASAGLNLAADKIDLVGARAGSIRYPHFPITSYRPGQVYRVKITAKAGEVAAEKTLMITLTGDGKPALDEFFAWEQSLPRRDVTTFDNGTGNWRINDPEIGWLENGTFIGHASRKEFIHYPQSRNIGDFTFEFDVCLRGYGNGYNGAPVAMATRERRQKPHPHTAVRAMQVNTYGNSAFIMDETWRPVGEKMPYRGAKGEIDGEQWMHMKLVRKGERMVMYVNDWPVYSFTGDTLAETWLAVMNGYENFTMIDNIVVKYQPAE